MGSNLEFEVDARDVEFHNQGGKARLARIYQPKGPGPFPTIIDVHGGAWHNGDRTNNVGIDRALATKGILVAALDFRQPPEAGYPAGQVTGPFGAPADRRTCAPRSNRLVFDRTR